VAREHPEALVTGYPVFDATVPTSRKLGRMITQAWTHIETGGRKIVDPMCGFRVYPIKAALSAGARGDAMDFDIEVAVRMSWAGVEVINLPTRVRYLSESEGGVSHFRLLRDNVAISLAHARLAQQAPLRLTAKALCRVRRPR